MGEVCTKAFRYYEKCNEVKILHLGKYYDPVPGGIEQVVKEIVEPCNDDGISCDVLCSNTDSIYEETRFKNYTVFRTATLATFSSTSISIDYITKFRKIVKEYDIIHLHHPNPMAFLALYFVRPSAKIIVHWHSDIIRQKKLLKLFEPLQKWVLNRADVIIATSQNYVDYSNALQQFKEKVKIVPIGIQKHKPIKQKMRNDLYVDKKIIFALGRLVEYKGFEVLVESARYLDDSFMVLIAGTGPKGDVLKELITLYKLENKVKLLGRIDEEDKLMYYENCFAFCLPSITKAEAFGVVLLEAMAFGKPLVSSNIKESGMSWVNQHNKTGLLVDPGDVQQLASAFKKLANDKELYEEMSHNAFVRYEELFTREKMIDSLRSIYLKLLD